MRTFPDSLADSFTVHISWIVLYKMYEMKFNRRKSHILDDFLQRDWMLFY